MHGHWPKPSPNPHPNQVRIRMAFRIVDEAATDAAAMAYRTLGGSLRQVRGPK